LITAFYFNSDLFASEDAAAARRSTRFEISNLTSFAVVAGGAREELAGGDFERAAGLSRARSFTLAGKSERSL
jgi:hypothetical protein